MKKMLPALIPKFQILVAVSDGKGLFEPPATAQAGFLAMLS